MSKNNDSSYNSFSIIYTLIGIFTAVLGHHINNSIFWAIVDWIFWPFVWVKWLICQQVSVSVIQDAFSFFFK